MKEKKLTPKQAMFIKEYMIDLNATQAAIRAGYSEKTAYVIGWENLRKPQIQSALHEAIQEKSQKTGLTTEYVLSHLMELVERCMQKKPVMEFDYLQKDFIQKLDEEGHGVWEFDSVGANRALRSLGEHLALFKQVIAGDKDNPLLFEPIQIIKPKNKK